jgi:hypothetical protein
MDDISVPERRLDRAASVPLERGTETKGMVHDRLVALVTEAARMALEGDTSIRKRRRFNTSGSHV